MRNEFYEKINEHETAIETYQLALSKTIGVGKKMDIVFCIMRIVLSLKDIDKLKAKIDECKKLLEEGGDWERRNRLKVKYLNFYFIYLFIFCFSKVYEGIYFLMIRDLKSAATILLDTISTFNSPEIVAYKDVVFYTVLASMVSLGRKQLKDKVIHSPDILGVIREIPNLREFMDYENPRNVNFKEIIKTAVCVVSLWEFNSRNSQHPP